MSVWVFSDENLWAPNLCLSSEFHVIYLHSVCSLLAWFIVSNVYRSCPVLTGIMPVYRMEALYRTSYTGFVMKKLLQWGLQPLHTMRLTTHVLCGFKTFHAWYCHVSPVTWFTPSSIWLLPPLIKPYGDYRCCKNTAKEHRPIIEWPCYILNRQI